VGGGGVSKETLCVRGVGDGALLWLSLMIDTRRAATVAGVGVKFGRPYHRMVVAALLSMQRCEVRGGGGALCGRRVRGEASHTPTKRGEAL